MAEAGEDQPWESLDIDDSEISAFFRCRKRQNQSQLQSEAKTTVSLTPSQSQSIFELNSKSITNSQTHLASSSYLRLIPGPAGAVQAAMQRRETGGRDGEDPVPTQEFIRQVVESGDENDHDFSLNPWLCAMNFLRRKGMVGSDGKETYVPLGSIRSSGTQRLAQVVAVVKSYKPNGLGDVMVTLKDPTGTIGATIHHKVFLNGEFGKEISIGAVLILKKVVVFCPTSSTAYLNVTSTNIIKIISKDSGPPSKLSYPALEVSSIAPNRDSCRKSLMPEQTMTPLRVGTEGILSSIIQNVPLTKNDQNERYSDNDNVQENSFNRNLQLADEDLSPVKGFSRQDDKTPISGIEIHDETRGYNPAGSANRNFASRQANLSNDQDMGKTNGLENKIASKTSLPEWTDEQLEELLAFD